MKVINLIGASNTGKSTATYGLLYAMKKMGLNVEYASEYAKDMFGKDVQLVLQNVAAFLIHQNRKLSRLEVMGVEYAVTDTCLLLGNVYSPDDALPELKAVITAYFNQYDNTTFYLPPNENFAFSGIGRVQQNRDESNALVSKIEAVLPDNAIRLVKSSDYVWPILGHLGLHELATGVYPWSLLLSLQAELEAIRVLMEK